MKVTLFTLLVTAVTAMAMPAASKDPSCKSDDQCGEGYCSGGICMSDPPPGGDPPIVFVPPSI